MFVRVRQTLKDLNNSKTGILNLYAILENQVAWRTDANVIFSRIVKILADCVCNFHEDMLCIFHLGSG